MNNCKSEYFVSQCGVRQGENISPLLFSLYLNDLENFFLDRGIECINTDIEAIDVQLKLLLLLYADDTVILANTADKLQKALIDLEKYCDLWKLEVNCNKTKVIIFSKRKIVNAPEFIYRGNALETVYEFKYLGVLFSFNGNFVKCKKYLKEQASKAMFSVISKTRQLGLDIETQIHLFDLLVAPVLTYGCEVWGYGNNDICESLHLRFCKYILNVNKTTSNCMIYGELGRFHIDTLIKTKMLSYWSRIVTGKTTKISYCLYKVLFELYVNNEYRSPWIECIHNTLTSTGLNNIWLSTDFNPDWLKHTIKRKLCDLFIQKWEHNLNSDGNCIIYKHLKHTHSMENYLVKLPKSLSTPLCRFRCNNFRLSVVRGRFNNVPRERRFCHLCNEDKLGDEFHLLLECKHPFIFRNRELYIPHYYRNNVSMYKFINLFTIAEVNTKLLRNVCLFLKTVTAYL